MRALILLYMLIPWRPLYFFRKSLGQPAVQSCILFIHIVLDPSKGVCADPVERVAILEVEGPGPPGGVSERQLSPDGGGEKT